MEELNVKAGDRVLYCYGYSFNRVEKIVTVTKVTPTGRIRIDYNDCQYNKYGEEMGNKDRWSSTSSICQLTEEIEKKMTENNAILKAVSLCEKVNRNNLPYEKALKIIEILED